MKQKIIWIGLTILGIIVLIITLGRLSLRKKILQYAPPPTPKEAEKINQQTTALIERAKAEAVGVEKQREIDDILKEENPRIKLERLAKAVKELR